MKDSKHPIMSKLTVIMCRLELLLKQNEIKSQLGPKYELVSNKEFMSLFGISSGTATSWRDKSFIPFVTIESKIYYKLSDVKIFIDEHYHKKKV